jgi:polyphosphate kinase
MSDDTAHWKLAADGSWMRHYRADDGSLLEDMQNVLMRQVSQRKRTGVVR